MATLKRYPILTTRPVNALRLLSKRRAWFDESSESGGNNGSEPEGDKSQQDKPTFTHTRKDVDKAASHAHKEGREAGVSALLKDLGFEKADDLKAVIKTARDREEAEKTESQKATDAAAKEKDRADKAVQELTDYRNQVETERRTSLRNTSIINAAKTAKAAVPEDVVLWAEANAPDDLAKVLKQADGKDAVDETALQGLIEKCRTARPAWFGPASPGSFSTRDGRAPRPDQRDSATRGRNTNRRIIRGG